MVGRLRVWESAETAQDNLRSSLVVPRVDGLLNPVGDAYKRRQLQILVREIGEFDPSKSVLELVSEVGPCIAQRAWTSRCCHIR